MTKLMTYEQPASEYIVEAVTNKHARPGDFVRHKDCGGFGTLVAKTKDESLVLWAFEPVPPRYNPLSIEEDIYIPVSCQGGPNGTNCGGCMGRGCPKSTVPTVQNKEDVSWFKKQLDRILGKKK